MYKKWNTEEQRRAARQAAQVRYRQRHRKRVLKRARDAARERYYRDQPASRARLNAYRQRVRLEVITAYGGKCTCCGESESTFLAFDHIKGTTGPERAKERKSGISWYLKLRREGYPEHIQVLCHNCNSAKGFYGVCPHQQ
ncbi:hypothetical protein LCGC14_1306510 [marine sediment metagenome]|uniref:Uncharacterized protein n=1 Tax=marine sediment metagenome TaxID=412755 RepID=A0A0F9KNK7_9ZZZZ